MVLSLLVMTTLVPRLVVAGSTPDCPLLAIIGCPATLRVHLLHVGTSMVYRAFLDGTAAAATTAGSGTFLGTSSIVSTSSPFLGSVACSFLIPFTTLQYSLVGILQWYTGHFGSG